MPWIMTRDCAYGNAGEIFCAGCGGRSLWNYPAKVARTSALVGGDVLRWINKHKRCKCDAHPMGHYEPKR